MSSSPSSKIPKPTLASSARRRGPRAKPKPDSSSERERTRIGVEWAELSHWLCGLGCGSGLVFGYGAVSVTSA